MQGESSKSSEFHTTILYDGKRKTLRRYFSPRLAKQPSALLVILMTMRTCHRLALRDMISPLARNG